MTAFLTLTTGAFFTLTGYRKWFDADTRAHVFGLFDRLHVPKVLQGMIVTGELLGGVGLLLSLTPWFVPWFRPMVAALLLPIMFGAYALDTWPGVLAKQTRPIEPTKLASNALCTPEAQLIFILVAIAAN